MPTRKLDPQLAQQMLDAVAATRSPEHPDGNISLAARNLKMPLATLRSRLASARLGVTQERIGRDQLIRELVSLIGEHGPALTNVEYSRICGHGGLFRGFWPSWNAFKAEGLDRAQGAAAKAQSQAQLDALRTFLAKPRSLAEIGTKMQCASRGAALDLVDELRRSGFNVVEQEGEFRLILAVSPAYMREGLPADERYVYLSRPDNTFWFGVTADNHLGSKYERLDALNDSYDRFVRLECDRVYNCGNWIEGEFRGNRTSIHTHGLDAQLRYATRNYPLREGLTTYAVWGDDHEGWYAQNIGVDVGSRFEDKMREAGRTDWVNLGFMEAHVVLRNVNTGMESVMAVVHPGGGTAYADSYAVQKIIEHLDGGEKPAVALYGHYHKYLSGEYRNVFWILVPSTKDQDPWMRKNKIRSVVGAFACQLEQDPATGAIVGFTPKGWRYFNKGYYNDRWSHSDQPVMPERTALG